MTQQVTPTLPPWQAAGADRRLLAWLERNVEDFAGPMEAESLPGSGSGDTWLIHTASTRYVMRSESVDGAAHSAYAIEREYRVVTALAHTGVPVATTHALCRDEAVIGRTFYVMDFVDGRVFRDPALPELTSVDRAAIYDEMNRVVADLHNADYRAIDLGGYREPNASLHFEVSRWSSYYHACETQRIAAMERLIEWLAEHVPATDETSIVHGDYRLDNLIFDTAQPRIRGVLAWNSCTLGHPLLDFAHHCTAWRVRCGGAMPAEQAVPGIPAEADYVAAYSQRTGRQEIAGGDWMFYIAFNMFRQASLSQAAMVRDFARDQVQALAAAERARSIANAAWQQIQAARCVA